MSDALVAELRAQLQAMAEENQALRVGITQRDRWISELRSTVAALLGNTPYPLHIPAKRRDFLRNAAD